MENTNATLEILKKAILLERRGQEFYQKVADQAKKPEVKRFFQQMADDEEGHAAFLSRQFKAAQEKLPLKLDGKDLENLTPQVADEVLDKKLVSEIEAASYEAAAIAAAILMEERAIALYADRAKNAPTSEEREVYQFLEKWEKEHHHSLCDIDRQITEKIWYDNHFWPF